MKLTPLDLTNILEALDEVIDSTLNADQWRRLIGTRESVRAAANHPSITLEVSA